MYPVATKCTTTMTTSTTNVGNVTVLTNSATNATVDSMNQDTQVQLPLVLGNAGKEATTSQYRNAMLDDNDRWTEEEEDAIHRNSATSSKDVGTDALRGVGNLAAAHQDHHDVEDLEDGAGHRRSNPSGDPSSLDTWSYPVHASRTGLEECTPTAVCTSSSMKITRVTDELRLQEQIMELENETSRLHQLLQVQQMDKSKTTPCRQPRSESMCYDPRTATVHILFNCFTCRPRYCELINRAILTRLSNHGFSRLLSNRQSGTPPTPLVSPRSERMRRHLFLRSDNRRLPATCQSSS